MTSVAWGVDQVFAAVPGGIGTYVRELVPALAAQDPSLRITLFHARVDDARPEPWMADFRTETLSGTIQRLYPSWNLAGRPALPPSLASHDVVHVPSCVAVPPTGPGRRLVVTVHDLAFRLYPDLFPPAWRAMFRLGLRRAVRTADAIVTVSRNTAEDLVRLTKVDPAKLHVVPLAASLPVSPLAVEPLLERLKVRRPYLLSVGTLEPRKNLVRLVRAYRRAAAEGVPHVLVLAGPMGWGPQPLLRELRVPGPGEVVLTGAMAPDELDALYRGAAAFVYPSLYEGFGLPVVEAMSRGLPTVVSDVSSLPEVAGEAAIYVHPGSVRDLARAMQHAVEPEEAERLGVAARARADRFSWAETARLTLEVYQKAG
ncbi:MAG TPA: glycosyltransferase family 1 protein [Actinomycetota bacterium]|nr:glycosyltransferase family 1 protein [Actinomycetota bacterium]